MIRERERLLSYSEMEGGGSKERIKWTVVTPPNGFKCRHGISFQNRKVEFRLSHQVPQTSPRLFYPLAQFIQLTFKTSNQSNPQSLNGSRIFLKSHVQAACWNNLLIPHAQSIPMKFFNFPTPPDRPKRMGLIGLAQIRHSQFQNVSHNKIWEVLHNPPMLCVWQCCSEVLRSLLTTVNLNIGCIFQYFMM